MSQPKFITKFLYFSFKLLKITSTIYPFQIHQISIETSFFKIISSFSIKIFSIHTFSSSFSLEIQYQIFSKKGENSYVKMTF